MSAPRRCVRTYILLYEKEDGEEDVYEICAPTKEQAEYYAREFCEERGARLLAVEWAMNRRAM